MIHPEPRRTYDPPARTWRVAAGSAATAAAMGAFIGATAATALDGLGWSWTRPILAPLVALVAAGSVYGQYRHLPLDRTQARAARLLVATGTAMMVAAVAMGRPDLAGAALWFMAAVTVVVTMLAAGHDLTDDGDGSFPWAKTA